MNDERYSRQSALVPTEKLAQRKVTVIGVGAIGRQVALQLAAMGVQYLQLVDDDKVEESNIASQGYYEKDLGLGKAHSTGQVCKAINEKMVVEIVPRKFGDAIEFGETVFCCVDSITARRQIWESVKIGVEFFCDGRMAAESLRILTAYDADSRKYYPTTLFSQDEAHRGSCTAKTTIYCANVIAGIMVAQFAKYLRQLLIDPDIQLNLLASELVVGDGR